MRGTSFATFFERSASSAAFHDFGHVLVSARGLFGDAPRTSAMRLVSSSCLISETTTGVFFASGDFAVRVAPNEDAPRGEIVDPLRPSPALQRLVAARRPHPHLAPGFHPPLDVGDPLEPGRVHRYGILDVHDELGHPEPVVSDSDVKLGERRFLHLDPGGMAAGFRRKAPQRVPSSFTPSIRTSNRENTQRLVASSKKRPARYWSSARREPSPLPRRPRSSSFRPREPPCRRRG